MEHRTLRTYAQLKKHEGGERPLRGSLHEPLRDFQDGGHRGARKFSQYFGAQLLSACEHRQLRVLHGDHPGFLYPTPVLQRIYFILFTAAGKLSLAFPLKGRPYLHTLGLHVILP